MWYGSSCLPPRQVASVGAVPGQQVRGGSAGAAAGERQGRSGHPHSIISRVKIYTKTGDAGRDVAVRQHAGVEGRLARRRVRRGRRGQCLPGRRAGGRRRCRSSRRRSRRSRRICSPSARVWPIRRPGSPVGSTKAAVTRRGRRARWSRTIDGSRRSCRRCARFILPGGSPAGALLHLARTVCRRAERRVVGLGAGAVEPILVVYLNRLSDLLFVMARAVNHRARMPETEW